MGPVTHSDAAGDRLPGRRRLAVTLHYYLGLSAATAAVVQCSTGTVKSTLFDARSRLRTDLEEAYQ